MSKSIAAWECAYVLLQDFAGRLNIAQLILCVNTQMADPDHVPNPDTVIALYQSVVMDRV
jgi:hypothetical protein